MGRFDCIYTLKKFHASKATTLNLSVKIEKNKQIISSNIDEFYFFVPLNFGNKAINTVVTRQVWDQKVGPRLVLLQL
jgi:hypothetical protein